MQYLGWLALAREDLLTARAYAPELEAMSRRVMAALDAPTDRLAPAAARARARLARLAPYVAGAVPPRSRWRRPVVACAVLAGATGVALAIADAVHYRAPDPDRPIPTLENPSHGKD